MPTVKQALVRFLEVGNRMPELYASSKPSVKASTRLMHATCATYLAEFLFFRRDATPMRQNTHPHTISGWGTNLTKTCTYAVQHFPRHASAAFATGTLRAICLEQPTARQLLVQSGYTRSQTSSCSWARKHVLGCDEWRVRSTART